MNPNDIVLVILLRHDRVTEVNFSIPVSFHCSNKVTVIIPKANGNLLFILLYNILDLERLTEP
ncbi:hypothetical protein, partial [Methylobacterium bullatum]